MLAMRTGDHFDDVVPYVQPTPGPGVFEPIAPTTPVDVKLGKVRPFTYDSQSNFVFTEPVNARGESGPAIARSAYEHLYAHKVLVRYFPNHPLTASFLRISIGTNAEMAVLREQLDAWQRS